MQGLQLDLTQGVGAPPKNELLTPFQTIHHKPAAQRLPNQSPLNLY
jgi:hypothetical protein